MEAASTQRAALRLFAAGGGVLLTVALVAATGYFVVFGRPEQRSAAAVDAAPTTPELPRSPDLFGEVGSYRLPLATSERPAMTPVTQQTLTQQPVTQQLMAPLAYEPPRPLRQVAPTPPEPVSAAPRDEMAPYAWNGALTINNPAAMGPPEDDAIPPVPVASPSPRVALARSGPRFDPAAPYQYKAPTPAPRQQVAAEAFDAFEDGSVEGSEAWSDDEALLAVAAPLRPHADPRPLREMASPEGDALLTYTASTKDLSRRLEPEVQAGFELGKAGAVYAARSKFVEVLRRIAMANDAAEGSTRCAEALAAGLRTLDEADDFIPKGDALEAELDVAAIARSHGVRLLSDAGPVAPHEAIARYSQYAAQRLAEAAADEPAGSMALHGLGKTYARLEAQGGDASAGRKCAVMYRAAIDAHAENYLAANELGVRLAQVGRYEQAREVLKKAASQPSAIATVHSNLAAVEQKLGREQAAIAARTQGDRLAQRERLAGDVSRRHGVDWVDPAAFRQAPAAVGAPQRPTPPAPNQPMTSQPMTGQSVSSQPMLNQPMPTQPMMAPPQAAAFPAAPGYAMAPASQPSGWRSWIDRAKQATGWAEPPASQPTAPPAIASQPRVYR
ncbi:hypothetical protein Pla108_16780 [Botrimarina colliarenosi]|uniref:Tetratricopeptide repeat protein n=1 Tax=Botrimarina colliarenosi TaxID=2528001 RepID=A0A5C6ANP7_9BACT|nr:hypothetical protein [Botrimarina colliarenosi]TWU00726.1 hypothetical protein Pla108_16780 [Botrimarina colliarenosi]